MREIKTHIVEGDSANHQLKIEVTDEPGAGGANHRYEITNYDPETNPSCSDRRDDPAGSGTTTVLFQNGPIKEVGVNGITQEALLAIVIDRLEAFQSGKFHSDFNQMALEHCQAALGALQRRTRERIARQVEGTHAV